jgi:thiol-disulfide isomerase/thioredoxin
VRLNAIGTGISQDEGFPRVRVSRSGSSSYRTWLLFYCRTAPLAIRCGVLPTGAGVTHGLDNELLHPQAYRELQSFMRQIIHAPIRLARSMARGYMRCVLVAVAAILSMVSLSVLAATHLIGQPAPDFVLRSRGADNQRLSEHLGEVVVINFWATWCGPCRQEMPLLDELRQKYDRAGMVLLSINIDDDDVQDRVSEMVSVLKVTYPILLDTRKEVARAYDVGTMPVTVLVDREGVVRYVSEGFKPGYEKRYAEQLRELLNE